MYNPKRAMWSGTAAPFKPIRCPSSQCAARCSLAQRCGLAQRCDLLVCFFRNLNHSANLTSSKQKRNHNGHSYDYTYKPMRCSSHVALPPLNTPFRTVM